MIIYYVPCKNKKEARNIAKELLQRKLIACANLIPSQSIYSWNDNIRTDKETVLILKTLDRWEEEVKKAIIKLHSYDIPAIIKLSGRVNEEYLSWMENNIEKQKDLK